MAYAALISLARTIYRLLNSCHISVLPDPSPVITVFHDDELEPLHEILRSLDSSRIRSERLSTLDVEIREAAYKLEDAIEALVSNQLLSDQPRDGPPFSISIDLDELKQDLDSFAQTVKKTKEEYVEELSSKPQQQVNVDAADPFTGGKKTKMVGFSRLFKEVKGELKNWYRPTVTVALSGMAGIGKTTLAREIFEDPEIEDYFESLIWVRVGPEYQLKEILRQVSPEAYEMISEEEGDEDELAMLCLYQILQDKRSLLVLDDIWEFQVFKDLEKLVPNYSRSRILVTSTIQEVAESCSNCHYRIPFLNKEESWHLLRDEVFGDQQVSSYPFALERAGKKIAEKCEGLPLLIVTVAGILSKAEKTVEYWNEVAETKQHSVFTDAYEQVSKFLLPSYNYLPQHLKACFLYMGILPPDSEISRSNLINLWRAEGFLGPNFCSTLEGTATEFMAELDSRNVVIVRQKVGVQPSADYKTTKYHLHSTFLHLCVKEAAKYKFYYVLNRYAEDAEQSMKGQRRLCIQNKVLLGIEVFYNAISSILDARSLLCTGSYHQYPVPICSGMRFLRVLDSLTIRFYKFPVEVLELIMLRYLAMTYDGDLPASVSKLWNLESLIVSRHIMLKSSRAPSYLPMEIWNMKELKHLQVTGSDLPDPCETSLLPNLLTLLDVTFHSCTQRVLDKIPFLETLGIQTEFLAGAAEPVSYFDQIPSGRRLETLTIIVNPIFMSEVVAPPPPPPCSIMYPYLKKLSLSGLGYQWEHMRMIASLPKLKILKLRCNAFRGPEWETPLDGFSSLTYLAIEDSDLAVWKLVGEDSFWNLARLSLKDCYQLEEIPERLEKSLNKIEVIDCNPSVVSWAKQRKDVCDVYVHSSWE